MVHDEKGKWTQLIATFIDGIVEYKSLPNSSRAENYTKGITKGNAASQV